MHDLHGCGDFAGEMNFRYGVAETSWQTVHGSMARRSHFLLVAAFQQLSSMTVRVQSHKKCNHDSGFSEKNGMKKRHRPNTLFDERSHLY